MSSSSPDERRFHRDHLWVMPAADQPGEVYVGISDFAQKQLGKILFVELPRAGERIEGGAPFGTVESYKVVSELIAPLTGEVVDANPQLRQAAGLVNEDCYGNGWLVRIRMSVPEELSPLLTADAYLSMLGSRAK
jgi:glycine cleavage system H protein